MVTIAQSGRGDRWLDHLLETAVHDEDDAPVVIKAERVPSSPILTSHSNLSNAAGAS